MRFKKQTIKKHFIVGFLLGMFFLPFVFGWQSDAITIVSQAEAKTKKSKKTSWQKKLEIQGVPKYLWKRHLPRITKKEYKKVLKKYKIQVARLAATLSPVSEYPLHQNITATYFWVGEGATSENGNISNVPSAWDELWLQHYGGIDDPNSRREFFPSGFTPQENPFYVALPYNDFTEDGIRKASTALTASWLDDKIWAANESACKNRWVKVIKNDKIVYAQWEDVGPFNEDDESYVYGGALPSNTFNAHAGIDVSPAVKDYLGLSDVDTVHWQFVRSDQVPDGPWKQIVTTSLITWL